MASENLITLYDVPSDLSGKAWGPNTWKIRYALSFKGIPYKTSWLEYPDIEPTMRSIGAAPTGTKPDGSPFYTIPVISDPSHRTASGGPMVVSESFLIAEYLDDVYPTTGRLFPEGTKALQKLFYDHFFVTTMQPIGPLLISEMYNHLNEGSRLYMLKNRKILQGVKPEDVCPKGSSKRDEVWANVQNGFSGIAALLDNNVTGGGGFIMGSQPTFSDFVAAAFLETIFLIDSEEWRTRVQSWDGGRWIKLRDACSNWRSVQ